MSPRCPFPSVRPKCIGLLTPISVSQPGERVWGCRSLGPAAHAALLLPARPHLWPRRQPCRDSCISRCPPLGSRPRLAFSASRLPAAPPRHRAGPAAATAAAGSRPSPAARLQRPAGADARAVLGKTPIRARRACREPLGAALHPGLAAPPSPGASQRRGRESRGVASLSPCSVPTASREPAPPRQFPGLPPSTAARLLPGLGLRGRAAPGAAIRGVVAGRRRGGRDARPGEPAFSRVSAPWLPALCGHPPGFAQAWGCRLNGDGEAGARARS